MIIDCVSKATPVIAKETVKLWEMLDEFKINEEGEQ